MYFRIGYTFIGNNNQQRSSALILEAKDAKEAQKLAEAQLKTLHPAFKITSYGTWTPN